MHSKMRSKTRRATHHWPKGGTMFAVRFTSAEKVSVQTNQKRGTESRGEIFHDSYFFYAM